MCAHLQLVGDEEDGLLPGGPADGVVEEVGANAGIQRAQRVVQEQDGAPAVEGAGQAHPLPLPATQVGATLPNLQRKNEQEIKSNWIIQPDRAL